MLTVGSRFSTIHHKSASRPWLTNKLLQYVHHELMPQLEQARLYVGVGMNRWKRRAIFVVGGVIAIALLLLLTGYTFERLAEGRDLERFPPPGQLVDVGGRKLHINCQGTGVPTVIVETGAGQFSAHWTLVQDAIARSTRICTYDRAGFGWSEPAPAGRSLEDRATELYALLTKASVAPPYIVVGHSYGGLVARAFVRAHFKDVVAVVLVDAAEEEIVFSPEFKELFAAARPQLQTFELLTRFGLARAILRTRSEDEVAKQMRVPRELIERTGLTAAGLSPGFFQEYADELASYELAPTTERHAGGLGALGDLPLIVIERGRPVEGSSPGREQSWTEAQARLAKLSSHSELIVASNSAHDIYHDEPQIVINAIQRVIRDSELSAK
jgi:pimeloyl-ACP methyl ester carboxylesterase